MHLVSPWFAESGDYVPHMSRQFKPPLEIRLSPFRVLRGSEIPKN